MATANKGNKPGVNLTDPGDWGSFPCLAFALTWFGVGTRPHDLVFAAFDGLLAIFTNQFAAILSDLNSKTIDSKGFRRRKLRKPPDKTNDLATVAHTRPQKQLNNLIFRFKTNERTVSKQKRMRQSFPRVSCNNTWNLPINSNSKQQAHLTQNKCCL